MVEVLMRKGKKRFPRNQLDEVKELFRKEGIKLTHQRLEVLEEISMAEDHPSAEKLYDRIRKRLPTISIDTIYRTLGTIERMGLISRVEVLDDQSRFDPTTELHHHLVCVSCKSIEDFYWPSFDKMKPPVDTGKWGRMLSNHAELRGICTRCLKERSVGRGGRRGRKK